MLILYHLNMVILTHLTLEKADSLPGLLSRLWKLGGPCAWCWVTDICLAYTVLDHTWFWKCLLFINCQYQTIKLGVTHKYMDIGFFYFFEHWSSCPHGLVGWMGVIFSGSYPSHLTPGIEAKCHCCLSLCYCCWPHDAIEIKMNSLHSFNFWVCKL